jgi:hypothetical protein
LRIPNSPKASTSESKRKAGERLKERPVPAGYQPIGEAPRDRLLQLAGLSEDGLAQLAKKSLEKKLQLMEANSVQYFASRGVVCDERVQPDYRVQLDAARAIDEMVGVKAPPAKQTVTVVHKLELPDWMCPDDTPAQTIEVEGRVEP